jgi:hypothetical protein
MKKLLATIALLLILPISAQANYKFDHRHVRQNGDNRACGSIMRDDDDLTMVIVHENIYTNQSECFFIRGI